MVFCARPETVAATRLWWRWADRRPPGPTRTNQDQHGPNLDPVPSVFVLVVLPAFHRIEQVRCYRLPLLIQGFGGLFVTGLPIPVSRIAQVALFAMQVRVHACRFRPIGGLSYLMSFLPVSLRFPPERLEKPGQVSRGDRLLADALFEIRDLHRDKATSKTSRLTESDARSSKSFSFRDILRSAIQEDPT